MNGAFGTLDFLIDYALDEFKNEQKLLLKDLCANISGFQECLELWC